MAAERVSPTKLGLWVIGAVTLAAGGALAGAAYVSPAAPASLQPAVEITSFPVHGATFEDKRPVRLHVVRDGEIDLTSPGSGRVTDHACTPGEAWDSGTSPVSLDDKPIVALATSLPLWRDLSLGHRGNDVEALQEELARLGYSLEVTGTLDWATIVAMNGLLEDVGDTARLSDVPRERILWLPQDSVVMETCSISTGADVTAGDEIGSVPGGPTMISLLDEVPDDLVEGPRVLLVDGVQVKIDPGSPITQPARLKKLNTSPAVRMIQEGEEPVAAQIKLAEPIQVTVVPPASIHVSPEGVSCVTSNGVALPVRIVGSELGQTFVIFEGSVPDHVDSFPRGEAPCI